MKFISLTTTGSGSVTIFVNVQNIASFNRDSGGTYSVIVFNFADSTSGTAHTINVTETAEQITAKIFV